jgi:hypothetical protein
VEQADFIKAIDEIIAAKKLDPTFGGALSGITVHHAAKDLYKIITGRNPNTDSGYKKYLLNVFKFFPEDPLQNSKVKCNVKGLVKQAIDGVAFKKGGMCSH